MNLFLLLLSAIAMIISLVLGFQNRTKLIETRQKTDTTNKAIIAKNKEIESVNDDIEATNGEKAEVWAARGKSEASLGKAKRDLTDSQTALAAAKRDNETKTAKLASLRAELDKLPDGVSPETLGQDIERLRTSIADTKEEIKAVEKDIEIAEQSLRKEKATLARSVQFQDDRTQSFNVNSLEATVTAVNRDLGFAIINAGESDGVTADLDLLVLDPTRTPKARLDITQIENGQLVAQINFDSVQASGQEIRAGDRVILRKPNTGIK